MALNQAKINCTRNWLTNVAATGTFVRSGSSNCWELDSVNGIPTNWTEEIEGEINWDGLKFIAVEDTTITLNALSNLEYSTDGGNTWNIIGLTGTINLLKDEEVCFKGKNTGVNANPNSVFSFSGKTRATGNIMSIALLASSPGTQIGSFKAFFKDCPITTAPELPATTLSDSCYYNMFYGCTSLTEAPELQATTLASSCYSGMFYDCTSLTNAPELPATTLQSYSYSRMFYGCTSLNKVVSYIRYASASYALREWLYNVSPTGDFYNLGGYSFSTGAGGIPSGWTVHTSL